MLMDTEWIERKRELWWTGTVMRRWTIIYTRMKTLVYVQRS